MSAHRPRELPRPEDRRRGDLERWLGSGAEPSCRRSEAFAEDLPLAAPLQSATAPLNARTAGRQTRWSWGVVALALARSR